MPQCAGDSAASKTGRDLHQKQLTHCFAYTFLHGFVAGTLKLRRFCCCCSALLACDLDRRPRKAPRPTVSADQEAVRRSYPLARVRLNQVSAPTASYCLPNAAKSTQKRLAPAGALRCAPGPLLAVPIKRLTTPAIEAGRCRSSATPRTLRVAPRSTPPVGPDA